MMLDPRFRWTQRLLLVQAALGLVLAACTTTRIVTPRELARLDGYDATQAGEGGRELETVEGDKVRFQRDSRLYLSLPGASPGGSFESIRIREGVFEGQTEDKRQIRAPMADIKVAKVEQQNHGGSALLVAALAAAIFAAIALTAPGSVSGQQPVSGRALRVAGRIVAAPLVPAAAVAAGWGRAQAIDTASLSPGARAALATGWTACARGEHASVPAFSRLSLTLMAMGAPADLVEAAHRAAIDEIAHARLSFALAGAYAGVSVAPGPLAELDSAPAVTARSLPELAEESLIDGCLLEGVAAAAAAAAGARAVDPAVRDALGTIARDERSHAELAWAVVAWCCAEGGPELPRRLRRAMQQARTAPPPLVVPPELEAEVTTQGFLAAAEWRDLFQRTRADVASRLAVVAKLGPTAAAS
jgi:hypothetical protein